MVQDELKKSFEQYWPILSIAIDQAIGQHISTSRGFEILSDELLRRTGKKVSASTLKRIYGYVNEKVDARESTLDVLALFAGYGTWAKFCKSQENANLNTPGSGFVNARRIDVSELPINSIVRLSWAPDRLCACLYRGDFHFEVLRSQNTRLVPGTTFVCALILSDQVLVLDQVRIEGKGVPAPYSIGRIYGIQFDLIIP